MRVMGKSVLVFSLTLLVLFCGFSSASATSPAKIVSGLLSNVFSVLLKWLWSLKATTKTVTGRSTMKFESGYNVETVFDGSKLGIEPFSVEVLPSGELLVLDSANSNLYKISSALSQYSRPKLVAGSAEGYYGHVDGKPRDVRMNHPKGLTVDDKGNIYIADTMNMAIRKISDSGVTTIAGGKWGRGGGHVDGPSEDAKFSNDFDVVYIGSSCSLLVIDRGNQAIREIQLNFDDCAYHYGSGFPLGIAVLVAAGFFGYMLAMLQHRVGTVVSSQSNFPSRVEGSAGPVWEHIKYDQEEETMKPNTPPIQYQKSLKSPIRAPLIPTEYEQEKQEQGFSGSLGKLLGPSMTEFFGTIFPGFRKKPMNNQYHHQQQQKYSNSWPVQESFMIPDDEPPSIETRTPTPRKTYPFMSNDAEKMQKLRQSRAFYSEWDEDSQQKQTPKQQYQYRHHHQNFSSTPQTYYEQNYEKTDEILFGAVQVQDEQCDAVVIKPLDHGNPVYDRKKTRSRIKSVSYAQDQ